MDRRTRLVHVDTLSGELWRCYNLLETEIIKNNCISVSHKEWIIGDFRFSKTELSGSQKLASSLTEENAELKGLASKFSTLETIKFFQKILNN